ncbi:MAG: ribbon-helix-helix domain-containing protein [Steroidobacterales bacterium]
MCRIYLARDPIQYESRSRTLRIHGVVTTIRLENEFWRVLQKIAESESKTTNELINQFYDEAVSSTPDEAPANFSSVLRVTCCRYLELNGADAPEAQTGARALKPQLEVVRVK